MFEIKRCRTYSPWELGAPQTQSKGSSEHLGYSRGTLPNVGWSREQLLVEARNCSPNFPKHRPPWM